MSQWYITPLGTATFGGSVASGYCTETLTWTIYRYHPTQPLCILVLGGEGDMPDYASPSATPWHNYASQIIMLGYEAGCNVTSIGACAFWELNLNQDGFLLPPSVAHLGEASLPWRGEINLKDTAITTIGTDVFKKSSTYPHSGTWADAVLITSISLPPSLMTIEDGAFADCPSLTMVFNHSSLNLVKGSDDYGKVAKRANYVVNKGCTLYMIQTNYRDEGGVTRVYWDKYLLATPTESPTVVLDTGSAITRGEGWYHTKWQLQGGESYPIGRELVLTPKEDTSYQTMFFDAVHTRPSTELRFDLMGGRSGPSDLIRASAVDVGFEVPTTMPVRTGYSFQGWADTPDNATDIIDTEMIEAGTTITVSAGTVKMLYAVWHKVDMPWSSQGELFLPYCGIRIWKNDTAYFNATFYQAEGGLAVISKAENRPGSAKFTLINDYGTATKRLLASTFAQWSDNSTGAIAPGMFVQLLNIRTETIADVIFDGYITTISPDAETVTFEVADQITMASKAGSFLRRNYKKESNTKNTFVDMDADTTERKLTKSLSGLGTIIAVSSMETSEGVEVTVDTSDWAKDGCGTATATGSTDTGIRVRKLEVKVKYDYLQPSRRFDNYKRTVTLDASVVGANGTGTFTGSGSFTVNTPRDSVSTSYYSGTATVTIRMASANAILGGTYTVRIDGTQDFPKGLCQSGKGTVIQEVKVYLDTPSELTPSTSITIDNATDDQLEDPTARLYVSYLTPGASIASTDVMSGIAEAMGWGCDVGVPLEDVESLTLYRIGGSYAQDYLQKLADIATGSRSRLSYEIVGKSPTLRIGKRYTVEDAPLLTIAYGGDREEIPGAIAFSSCSLGRTFKNRPNMVTLKGTLSDDKKTESVTLTIEDPASFQKRGIYVETIVSDTNATTMQEVGKSAYATLRSSDLDQWEGTVTIPGIVLAMSEGSSYRAGSGIPVRIVDSRIALDEVVRVKQAEYDFQQCATKLTVGNYNAVYSNTVKEANALAVSATDAVGAVSDTSLYFQQSLYLKKDAVWTYSPTQKVMVRRRSNGAWINLGLPTVYELPPQKYDDNGVERTWQWYVLTVKKTAEASDAIQSDYDIDLVGLGGSFTIPVPLSRSPDYFFGQTLTVTVMVRKS